MRTAAGSASTTPRSPFPPARPARFAMHNAGDLMVRCWQQARRKLGARNRLFTHIWSISAYHVFTSWNALMRTILTGVPPPKTA